jgi:hypothetical protein
MPLASLDIRQCPELRDVTPLRGMSIVELGLTPKLVTQGIDGLRSMTSLKLITMDNSNRFVPAEFWKRYDAGEFSK